MKNFPAAADVAILFARVPSTGQMGTGMIAPEALTPEQAYALHLACIGDMADLMHRALPAAQKWIYWSEAPGPEFSLGALNLPASFGIALQSGADADERIGRALERTLAAGAQRVVLVGTRSPTLPLDYLSQALGALDHSDVVLGPTEQGGFYLLGARRFARAALDGVAWGAANAFAQAANVTSHGLSLATLPAWYELREWRDVRRMIGDRQAVPLPRRVAEVLASADRL